MEEVKTKKDELIQLVSFDIDSETYGLAILNVQEVIRLPHITRLPRSPHFIKGVINLRGNVIPIIDLREKFGMRQKTYHSTTRAIIVEVNDRKLGMVVDNVSQVIRIYKSEIAPPPPMIGGLASDYISGVVEFHSKLVILLEIEKILSEEEVISLDESTEIAEHLVKSN